MSAENIKMMEKIAIQEVECTFDKFSSEDALKLGNLFIKKAKENNYKIAINISLNRRQLFHYSFDGMVPDNDHWIRRKENSVYRFFRSTLYSVQDFEHRNLNLKTKYGLDDSDYTITGGGFPLNVKGVGTIGAICVTGLWHEDDHLLIVETIKEFLGN